MVGTVRQFITFERGTRQMIQNVVEKCMRVDLGLFCGGTLGFKGLNHLNH